MSIHTVGKDISSMLSFSDEIEGNGQIASCPISHRSHIPNTSLPTGDNRIFTQLSIKCHRFIESRWNLSDEIGTFLILHILRRTVGHHLQRCLKGGVHRHLVDTRALTHRMIIVAKETILHRIHHRTRRIVHRSCQHTQIRRSDVIARLVVQWSITHTWLPFRILQSLHTFKVEDVRISPLDTEGFQTVIVEIEVILGGTLSHLIGRGDNLLVVTIKEIYLETLDAHIGIVLHHSFRRGNTSQRIATYQIAP